MPLSNKFRPLLNCLTFDRSAAFPVADPDSATKLGPRQRNSYPDFIFCSPPAAGTLQLFVLGSRLR